jgi:hypothetical protein
LAQFFCQTRAILRFKKALDHCAIAANALAADAAHQLVIGQQRLLHGAGVSAEVTRCELME